MKIKDPEAKPKRVRESSSKARRRRNKRRADVEPLMKPSGRDEDGIPVYNVDLTALEAEAEIMDQERWAVPPETKDTDLDSKGLFKVLPSESMSTLTTPLTSLTREQLVDVIRILKPLGKLVFSQ